MLLSRRVGNSGVRILFFAAETTTAAAAEEEEEDVEKETAREGTSR